MANMTIFPTGLTYSRNTKAPLESNRLFDTLLSAQAYVDDKDQNAYVGMTISVTNDGDNNGLYYVEKIADSINESGFLKKVGSDTGSLSADVEAIKVKIESIPKTIVSEVKVGGISVVTNGVANIDLSSYAKSSDLDVISDKIGSSENSTGLYGLISKTASDLRNEMSVIPKFSILVVDSLPTSNQSVTTVYLVKDKDIAGDLYTEYIYVNGAWENLGKQRLDLSAYSTTDEMNIAINAAISSYVKTSELNHYKTEVSEALGLKANSLEVYDKITSDARFVKVENYVAFSQDEKTKLANISENAQVNVIEAVKVKTTDSEEAISVTNKSVTIDLSQYAKSNDVHTKNEIDVLLGNRLSVDVTVNDKSFVNNAVIIDSSDIKLSASIVNVNNSEELYNSNETVHGVLSSLSARIDNLNTLIDGELNGIASIQSGNGIKVSEDTSSPMIEVIATNASISSTTSGISVKVADNSALTITDNGLDLMWTELY